MDDLYRDYILEHYRRPHNFGVLEHANVSHEGANPLCGDRITLQLRLADGKVAGVGFTGRGCAISQASASLLTDEIKGKGIVEAASMSSQDVLDLLGIDISPARLKCALLSLETMQLAIAGAGKTGPAPSPRTGVAEAPGAAEVPGAAEAAGFVATPVAAPVAANAEQSAGSEPA